MLVPLRIRAQAGLAVTGSGCTVAWPMHVWACLHEILKAALSSGVLSGFGMCILHIGEREDSGEVGYRRIAVLIAAQRCGIAR